MAPQTGAGLGVEREAVDDSGEGAVAAPTIGLGDPAIEGVDLQRLDEPARREGPGMVDSVHGLARVMGGERLARVTVVAGGDAPVGALLPGPVLRGHDVAVEAARRVVAEIGGAPGEIEGEDGGGDEEGERGPGGPDEPAPVGVPGRGRRGGLGRHRISA
jgi:hypothetical protein